MQPTTQMTSPFETLPNELLNPIFANLELHELLPLCFTCRSFLPAAKAALYKQIKLSMYVSTVRDYAELQPKTPSEFGLLVPSPGQIRETELQRRRDLDQRITMLQRSVDNMKLWKRLCESPDGLLIKDAGLHVIDDLWKPIQNFDYSFITTMFLESLSQNSLTKLSIDYCFIHEIGRFPRLKHLSLNIGAVHLKLDPITSNLGLTSLESLAVHWLGWGNIYGSASLALKESGFLGIICSLAVQFTSVKHLSVDTSKAGCIPARDIEVVEVDPRFSQHVGRVWSDLNLPNLTSFEIDICPQSMNAPVRIAGPNTAPWEGITSIYDVFARLIGRHKDQLRSLSWTGGILPRPFLPVSPTYSLETLPNLETLKITLHICRETDFASMHRSSIGHDMEWANVAVNDARLRKSMKRLTIIPETFDRPAVAIWLKEFIPKLPNLTHLSIEQINRSPTNMYKQTGAFNPIVAALGFENEDILARSLSSTIQSIFIGYSCSGNTKDDEKYVQSAFRHTQVLFELLPCLNSIELTLDHPRNAYLCPPSKDHLIFRRRAGDYSNSDNNGFKRLCIWHCQLLHTAGSTEADPSAASLSGHMALMSYREKILRRWDYAGADGDKWSFDLEGTMMVRACTVNGKGGCDEVLMREAIWVPLPPPALLSTQRE